MRKYKHYPVVTNHYPGDDFSHQTMPMNNDLPPSLPEHVFPKDEITPAQEFVNDYFKSADPNLPWTSNPDPLFVANKMRLLSTAQFCSKLATLQKESPDTYSILIMIIRRCILD